MNGLINLQTIVLGGERFTVFGLFGLLSAFFSILIIAIVILKNLNNLRAESLNKSILFSIGGSLACVGGIFLGINVLLNEEITFKSGQKLVGTGAIFIGGLLILICLVALVYIFKGLPNSNKT